VTPLPGPGLHPSPSLLPQAPASIGSSSPPPVYGPGMPELRRLAAWHYQQLQPVARGDHLHGYPLAHYCAALWAPIEDLAELISDQPDGTTGYARAMMVETCPPSLLRWLGQQVGVWVPPGTSPEDARRMIRLTRGWKRGKIPAMVAEVKTTLTGTKSVIVTERYGTLPAAAHTVRLITKTSETPNPTATLAAAKNPAHKRIGLIVDLLVVDGQTWNDARAADPSRTWDELKIDEPTTTWQQARDTDLEV
jgi:hypothetical protein